MDLLRKNKNEKLSKKSCAFIPPCISTKLQRFSPVLLFLRREFRKKKSLISYFLYSGIEWGNVRERMSSEESKNTVYICRYPPHILPKNRDFILKFEKDG